MSNKISDLPPPSQEAIENWTRAGYSYVCDVPSPVVRLGIENDCVVALLENGEKFVVPVECHESVVKN